MSMDRPQKSRGIIRAAVTRLISKLDALGSAEDQAVHEIQDTAHLLLERRDQLRDLDAAVQNTIQDDDAFEEDFTNSTRYQDDISLALSRARRITAPTVDRAPPPNDAGTPVGDNQRNHVRDIPSTSGVRTVALPKLHVPTFAGKLEDWQGFWDHFRTTIHECSGLPKIERFKYLLSYLSGPAKRSVEWINISESNYDVAIDTLQSRFGRPSLLVDSHIDKLLTLHPVASAKDVGGLRELYDSIQFRTGCLKNLGVLTSQYAVVLHRVLMRCLPEELAVVFRQRQIERAESAPAPGTSTSDHFESERCSEVEAIMRFLRSQIESREDCKLMQRRVHPREQEFPSFSEDPPAALALAARTFNGPQRRCPLCDRDSHALQDCPRRISPSEKRRLVIAKRCCVKCGKFNHFARDCRSYRFLTCSSCGGQHLSTLCDIQVATTDHPSALSAYPQSARPPTPPLTTATCLKAAARILLQTARAWAIGYDKDHLVRVMFDTGSHRTYIRKDLSRKLRCPVLGTEDITIHTFGRSKASMRHRCHRVALCIRSQYDSQPVQVEALEVPEVCSVVNQPIDSAISDNLRARGLDVADNLPFGACDDIVISVLIGCDVYWSMVSGAIHRFNSHLAAVETCFGWVVQGSCPHSAPSTSAVVTALSLAYGPTEDTTDPSVMWRLDAIGITDDHKDFLPNHPAIEQFEDHVTNIGSRYQVPLLIKYSCLGLLADNRSIAESRLLSQLRRLRDHPDLMKQYDDTISEYFTEGHAERVPDDPTSSDNVYYLPHHAVIRREAVTTKVRVVFDASSHVYGERSLNEVLHKGPNLNADLLRQLVSFRCSPVVLTADIRKAYLQIVIRPEDRDALRFLWVARLPSLEEPVPEIQEWRMTRVPFGASSSPSCWLPLFVTISSAWRNVIRQRPNVCFMPSTLMISL